MLSNMSKKSSTPDKDRKRAPKRSYRDDDEEMDLSDFSPNRSMPKRSRRDSDVDLTGLLKESNAEEDIASLFEGKFKEKSPASKLSSSFKNFGMESYGSFKKPKRSSFGGLTSAEREQKRMNRSLNFPAKPKSPGRGGRRSPSRSPKK